MIEDAYRTPDGTPVTAVTAGEMRSVDRVAVEELGIDLLQMMENAGRNLARHVRETGDGPVRIVAGNGGNGGGGLACARHLANRDPDVTVVLDRPAAEFDGAAARQLEVLEGMDVRIRTGAGEFAAGPEPAVVVDAIIGYGLSGDVRGEPRALVDAVNGSPAPVVSLDVPSGVDATTGETLGVAVAPDRTLTLALPKTGLAGAHDPVLADISVPAAVYRRLEIPYETPFGEAYRTPLEPANSDVTG